MSKNFKRNRSSRNSKTSQSTLALGPKQFMSNITFGHTYRFVSTSSTATAITPTFLLCSAGTICYVTNSMAISLFGSVRVTRIRMWAPVQSQGTAATCSVLWAGSVTPFYQDREISDTSVSVTKPAFIDCSPPQKSLAAFWQTESSNALFTLSAPVGTIIDVTLALTLQDEDGPAPATSTISTGVLSVQYYLSLDPNATHRYSPISLNTTF
jgi:hypothetical protein